MRELTRHVSDREAALDVQLGGFCPVQGLGTIGSQRLYFSARGDSWHLAIANGPEVDPVTMTSHQDGFYVEEVYAGNARSAGWMTLVEAESLVRRCVDAFLASTRRDA